MQSLENMFVSSGLDQRILILLALLLCGYLRIAEIRESIDARFLPSSKERAVNLCESMIIFRRII